ncbi:hypothetical protein BCR39DRAFT_524717 [Naematelia encephala]|uniref:Bacterial low temperature requirement A protein-domain-containing protein n=1 Tax=Naematelia encephala TaxID=71784 RepID=A0A1Y2BAR1_9TREE|nr:hypothetical protein BCR39DRAFT_524717 [Naematelia encephala]
MSQKKMTGPTSQSVRGSPSTSETVGNDASKEVDGAATPSAPVPGNSSRPPESKSTSFLTPGPARPGTLRQISMLTSRSKSSRISSIKHGAHHKRLRRLPFIRYPKRLTEGEEEEGPGEWVNEEDEATEWLNLLYDLAVVAVLSVFSSTHELSSKASIPIFLSYFAVLSWLWVSQVYYDIRFQAEDSWHRWVKSLQLVLFVYIGAASGNWSPGMIRDPSSIPNVSQTLYTSHIAARQSWKTVLIAYIASRVMLAVQYGVSAFIGRRAGRQIATQISRMATLSVSIILTIVAVALPARSSRATSAKIALFYLGLSVEILVGWFQLYRRLATHVNTRQVGARYGAFTLIILGEGIISITRAFSLAISGLSQSSSTTYGQVWLAIGIIYLLWCFLFARFRVEDVVNPQRALLWESLHFALHFALLLLLAALVNVIVVFAFADGIATVTSEFTRTGASLTAGTPLNSTDVAVIRNAVNRLPLVPSYEVEYNYLLGIRNDPNHTEDPTILAYQYWGQVMIQTTSSYGIDVSDEMLGFVQDLYAINTTLSDDADEQTQRHTEASNLLYEVIQTPVNEELSGILWLFPSAGGVLVLSAIRSMVWYRYPAPSHWIIHVPQLALGLVLAMLGLLDIGKQNIDVRAADASGYFHNTNPMYHIVDAEMPIAIVFLVYWVVWIGSAMVLNWRHRRKGDVYAAEEGAKPEGGGSGVIIREEDADAPAPAPVKVEVDPAHL